MKLDGHTLDIKELNIQKLKQLFPESFTDGKFDVAKMAQLLGDYNEEAQEKYDFTWHGKGKALKISQTPSMGTLRPSKADSKDWDNTQNLYIEGDNLEVLKLLQKSYYSKVKMIYIDPPYNTGKDFVYKDNFKDNLANYKELTEQVDGEGFAVTSNPETSGRYHTDWLNMMYPRLRLARNLLTDDGVIFISIDDNEVHNLRKICDEVFGEDNFIGQICWRRSDNQSNIGQIAKVKEYIIIYCKNREYRVLGYLPLSDKAKNEYRYKDKKGYFRRAIMLDKTRGRYNYDLETPSGNILSGPWMKSYEEFKKLDNNEEIYWTSGGQEQPYGKIYLNKSKGQICNDFWGIEFGTNQRSSTELRDFFEDRVFEFSKP
ncbi:MAG: site-specific DNA-methyltransferase, partial [Bacteroidales bacterium]|nr:site-specific DNA-methyltransferase [Bacteroidales bacterium]